MRSDAIKDATRIFLSKSAHSKNFREASSHSNNMVSAALQASHLVDCATMLLTSHAVYFVTTLHAHTCKYMHELHARMFF